MTRLRAARLRAGLDVRTAARLAGVRPSYLAALERRGATALTWARPRRLARLYATTPVALLGISHEGGQSRQVTDRKAKPGQRRAAS